MIKKSLKQKSIAVGVIFIVTLFIGMALTSAVTANKGAANGADFTPDELQELYRKYNITENDIKFAEGRLPHFLEETILDGKVVTMGKITLEENKVVVSEWVDPLFHDYCIKEGYKVISPEEWFAMEEKAREEYIKEYGVDPANPKIDIVDGVPLPAEYVRKLVKSGKISPKESGAEPLATTPSSATVSSTQSGPYAKYDKLYLWIFAAKDSAHKPTQAYLTDTVNAFGRFYQFSPGTLYYYHITDYWDASDVSPADSSLELLKDIEQDTDWVRYSYNDGDPVNDIVTGWADYMDHNGMAYLNGFFSVCAVKASGLDWPHDSIAQHEISHNFNAIDQGTWYWEHPECIMNYNWAYWG
ncbi:MAG TPA: hypothetical protein C5S37_07975, partial [Methanophagales archaeon]|nr:hypothetical protein [Methanophagales archaeon]